MRSFQPRRNLPPAPPHDGTPILHLQLHTHQELFANDDEGEEPSLSLAAALLMMAAITGIVAVSSE